MATIVEFRSKPASFYPGEEVELSWTLENAAWGVLVQEGRYLQELEGEGLVHGTLTLSPEETTEITLIIRGEEEEDEASATLTLELLEREPPKVSLAADRLFFDPEEMDEVILSWSVDGAVTLRLYSVDREGEEREVFEQDSDGSQQSGQVSVIPYDEVVVYRVEAQSPHELSAEAEVEIEANVPQILSFQVEPLAIDYGIPVFLDWETRGGEVSISPSFDELEDGPHFERLGEEEAIVIPLDACEMEFELCGELDFPEGFSFPFGQNQHEWVRVFSAGFLNFDRGPWERDDSGANRRLPKLDAPWVHLAPFWSYQYIHGPNPQIAYALRQEGDRRVLIIEWSGFAISNVEVDVLEVQIALFEDGAFEFRYGTLMTPYHPSAAEGIWSTLGWQLPGGWVGDTLVSADRYPGGLEGRSWRVERREAVGGGHHTPEATTDYTLCVTNRVGVSKCAVRTVEVSGSP